MMQRTQPVETELTLLMSSPTLPFRTVGSVLSELLIIAVIFESWVYYYFLRAGSLIIF